MGMFRRFLSQGFQAAVAGLGVVASLHGSAAPITPGNIVVFRAGSGTNALSSTTGNDVILDERTTSGSLVQSIAITATGAGTKLINAGAATAEGALSISPDGRWITFGGYNTTVGGAVSLPTSSSASIPRSIGIFDTTSGNFALTTAGTFYNAGAVRTAYSSDGNKFWAAGSNTGIIYGTVDNSSGVIVNGTGAGTNNRVLGQYGSDLYVSSASGTLPTVGLLGGNPLAGAVPTSSIALPNIPRQGGSPATSRYGFVFLDVNPAVPGIDTMYTVDDSLTSGGLWKYSLGLSGTWTGMGSITGTSSTTKLVGLTGGVSGNDVQLFMTGNGNSLYSFIDANAATSTLSGGTSSLTTIATAATNTAFRGVVLVPVPEPTALALVGVAGGAGLMLVRSRQRRRR